MFCDIKDQLDSPAVCKILSYCVFDDSPEGIAKDVAAYRRHTSRQFFGWVESDEILGVCGFEVHPDYVEILHIATAETARGRGIGGAMVIALWKKYGMPIEAETGDGAVGFYRKRGFEISAIRKYDVQRYTCILPAPKSLDQITDEERARLFPIILSEYNPDWPRWYAEESEKLRCLIGEEHIVRISHIGSTAVPGLTSKPTVDILMEISEGIDVDQLMAALPNPEYICLHPPTTPSEPPHLVFLKGYTPTGFADKVYHIHVRYPGDWDELRFRDYLIAHPEIAAEYAELKRKLRGAFEFDRDGYTEAKTEFIRSVVDKAKAERLGKSRRMSA